MNEIELSKDSDAVILTTGRTLALPGHLSHCFGVRVSTVAESEAVIV